MTRRPYIDWLRGVAVLIMISWHSIDSWSVLTGRDSAAFGVVMFMAGWAAPLFLFLAGVSVSLAGASRMARGADRQAVSRTLQRRGWEVFLLAHLFRFQSFLFNPNGQWNDVLKPDILNILGLGIVATAFCWGRATSGRAQAAWLLVPAACILVVLTPWSRHWWWPTLLHPRLEAYIRPVANYGVFALFPTVTYILVGAFLGARIAERDTRDAPFHRNMGIAGAILLLVGLVAGHVPSLFGTTWGDSISLFLDRTGTMTLCLAAAWVLLRHRAVNRWSPLVVFGQTSLFVYWVHVELAYGVFSYSLRHTLTLPWAIVAYLLLTLVMLGCAILWRQLWPAGAPLIPRHMVAGWQGRRQKLEVRS